MFVVNACNGLCCVQVIESFQLLCASIQMFAEGVVTVLMYCFYLSRSLIPWFSDAVARYIRVFKCFSSCLELMLCSVPILDVNYCLVKLFRHFTCFSLNYNSSRRTMFAVLVVKFASNETHSIYVAYIFIYITNAVVFYAMRRQVQLTAELHRWQIGNCLAQFMPLPTHDQLR
jgi:hypothetical protein